MKKNNKKKGLFIVFSGTSGTGKTTITKQLEELFKSTSENLFEQEITTTTREIRIHEGEINGVHYHFISKEDFEANITNDNFIEFTKFPPNSPVFNYYGTTKNVLPSITEPIKTIILTPDGLVNIEKECKKNGIHLLHIHIDITDEEKLNRLINRKDSEENIKKRMNDGIREAYMDISKDNKYNTKTLDCSSLSKEKTFIEILNIIGKEISENINTFNPKIENTLKEVLKTISKEVKNIKNTISVHHTKKTKTKENHI